MSTMAGKLIATALRGSPIRPLIRPFSTATLPHKTNSPNRLKKKKQNDEAECGDVGHPPEGQWQNMQLNQVEHSQAVPHSGQAGMMPFWLGQQHPGYHIPYYQLQPPSYSYPLGYPYPGPWNPSSWWAQQQQSVPPFTYTNLGPFSYLSSSPALGFSAASELSSQRATIQPPEELPRKHQQLLQAQSAENVRLWNVVGHLQSELANYKNRLTKLEADVLSPKAPALEPAGHGGGGALPSGKKTKRGRPMKQIAPNDVNLSTNQSVPRGRGRKMKSQTAESQRKEISSENYRQKQLEEKANSQKEVDVGICDLIFHNQSLDTASHEIKEIETKNSSPVMEDDR